MIALSSADDIAMESSLHVQEIIHHDIITLYSKSLLNTKERVLFYQTLLNNNDDNYFIREIILENGVLLRALFLTSLIETFMSFQSLLELPNIGLLE
jgi:hypothetical protein